MNGSPIAFEDIDFDLRRPCDDCPFKKGVAIHEGVAGSIPQYLEDIKANRFAHTCHKTDTRPQCDGPVRGREDLKIRPKHCAGAIIMLQKSGRGSDLQVPLLRALQENRLPVDEFIDMRKRYGKDVHTIKSLMKFYYGWAMRRLIEKSKGGEVQICKSHAMPC